MPEIGKTTLPGLRITDDGLVEIIGSSLGSNYVFASRVVGDTIPRFRIDANGTLLWSSGVPAADNYISRYAPNYLISESSLKTTGILSGGYDAVLGTHAFSSKVIGDAVQRIIFTNIPEIWFGGGAGPCDIKIYRPAADTWAFYVNAIDGMRVSKTVNATETYLMIHDVDNNNLERVSVGVANSGGAGFKLLRIPN